jgi:hypothetical protein
MSMKCAKCGKNVTHNIYYCSRHNWHLCWDCVGKTLLTSKLTCPKCGTEVSRVD